MYTEEIGVSPVQGNPAGYRFYVRQLIASGRASGSSKAIEYSSKLISARCRDPSARCRGSGWNLSCGAKACQLRRWLPWSSWLVRLCPLCRCMSTTTTSPPERRTPEWGSPKWESSLPSTFNGHLLGWQRPLSVW